MQKFRRWLLRSVGFTSSQVNGFLILLPLLLIILFSEPLWRAGYNRYRVRPVPDTTALEAFVALWEEELPVSSPGTRAVTHEAIKSERFAFDPNQVGFDSLRRLGVTIPLARRIIHYREKGGRFRVKRDLLRIYGFDSLFYETLKPYIQLPEKAVRENYFTAERTERKVETFDLNTADTARLKRIYGIGNALSQRVVRFREGLGGFISTSQLYEVYGLDSAVVQRLLAVSYIADGFQPRKFNVNTVDERGLASHPYVSGSVARAIVAYRFQHGQFHALDDLRNIPILTEAIIKKIEPYILFSE